MSPATLWSSIFFATSVLALVFIPSSQLRRLVPFGIVGGALLYYVISLAAVPLLRLWVFAPSAARVTGIPVMSVLACVPAAMLFQRLLETARSAWAQVGLVTAGAVGFTFVDWYALKIGAIQYGGWSLVSTLGLAGLVLSALAYYVDETKVGEAEIYD